MIKHFDTSLLLIIKNNKILLPMKKRGFGEGFFNGVGGKKQAGENIFETMMREASEEIAVKPNNAKLVAIIDFDFLEKGIVTSTEKMYVFTCEDYFGEITESEEMKPVWFDLNKIPYEKMFPDDIYWLPKVLSGEKLFAKFSLNEKFNVTFKDIKVTEELTEIESKN